MTIFSFKPQFLWLLLILLLVTPEQLAAGGVPPPHEGGSASKKATKAAGPLMTVDHLAEIRSYDSPHRDDQRSSLYHFGFRPTLMVTIDTNAEMGKPLHADVIAKNLKALDKFAKEARESGVDVVLLYFPFNGAMLDMPPFIAKAKLKHCSTALIRQFADGRGSEKSKFYEDFDKFHDRAGKLSWIWMEKPGEVSKRGFGLEDKALAKALELAKEAHREFPEKARELRLEISRLNFLGVERGLEKLKGNEDEESKISADVLSEELAAFTKHVRAKTVDHYLKSKDLPAYLEALEGWEKVVKKTSLEDGVKAEIKKLKSDRGLKPKLKAYKAFKKVRNSFDLARSRIVDPNRLSYEHWYGEQIRVNSELAKPSASFLKKFGDSQYAESVKSMQSIAKSLVDEAVKGLAAVKQVGRGSGG